jgi:FHS family L-fucose permease-like MFS transporter
MKQFTGVSERVAAGYLTATLVAMAAGRFFGTHMMKYFRPAKLLSVYGLINVILLAVAILVPGINGAYAIVVSSFFLSVMFPTIFALGLKGLGPNTKLGSSLLVMAIVGGAVFPPILGLIAKSTGSVAKGYIVPLLGYAVVVLYGLSVSRKRIDV